MMPTPLSRRDLLRGAPLALAWPGLSGAAPARKPGFNVLFIAVDDLRPELGCYGNSVVHSPNIDRLAARGLVFERAYCQQAVCSPSRTSLLTGRRPDTTRIYELQTHFRKTLPDVVTLPEQFKRNGYQSTGLGKIYHGGLNDPRSWSIPAWFPGQSGWGTPENAEENRKTWERLETTGLANPRPDRAGRKRGPSWDAPDVADNALNDGKTVDQALKAMNRLAAGPFFLAVGFQKPHLPFIAPKRYFDLYAKTTFRTAPNPFAPKGAPEVALHNSSELRSYGDIPKEGPIPDSKALELIRAYYAATSYTDAQIGRLLDELDRLKLRDKTVVILWGDHGWHLGEHGMWNKHSNFEVATRAPLIISAPGQKSAGGKTAALVEFVDIYPSLCDLCGVPLDPGLEGASFKPLLDDPSRPWKKAAFSQYPRGVPKVGQAMGYSMRTQRYRYTEWVVAGKDWKEIELYDYEKDPAGNVNAARDPANAALLRQLGEQLRQGWRAALPKT